MRNERLILLLAAFGGLLVLLGLAVAGFVAGARWERQRWLAGETGWVNPPGALTQLPVSPTTPTPPDSTPVLPSTTPELFPTAGDGAISGLVWHDRCVNLPLDGQLPPGCQPAVAFAGFQGNGVYDAGEEPLANITVQLGAGPCPAVGLAETTTRPDGGYTFTGLAPGVYCVSITTIQGANTTLLPGQWTAPAADGAATVELDNNLGQRVDFGWDYELFPEPLVPTPTPLPPPPTTTPVPVVNVTALPTFAPAGSPTPTPGFCDHALLLSDSTLASGARIPVGAEFVKTWRVKNIGTCTWTKDYDLVYVAGVTLTDTLTIPLPGNIPPNGAVDLSLQLTAPTAAGLYQGVWMLRNQANSLFGIGNQANTPFRYDIQATEASPYPFDMGALACLATWRNGAQEVLPCPGPSDSPTASGFMDFLDAPDLEDRGENEMALWVRPNNAADGQIYATYPPYTIVQGDQLRLEVGCLADSEGCSLTFQVDYLTAAGALFTLGSWNETFDGDTTEQTISLNNLVGQKVQFILRVRLRDAAAWEQADGFWFGPHIER